MQDLHFNAWPKGRPFELPALKTTVFENFVLSAGRFPDHPAIIYYDAVITYAELLEQVLDVAGEANATASVDPETCERSGEGRAQLCSVWRDPGFDPAQSAVYYARVLENPSCRWTSHQCNAIPAEQRPALCESDALQRVVQERAWTSPIFYNSP